jgi:hypothetical protein
MLVFIDESGDSGTKIPEGSSAFFIVSLVVFEDHDEAIACDQRIELLKRELGRDSQSEFHFKKNSDRIRLAFIKAVAPYNFFYYGIVLDKKNLPREGFEDKRSFYKYACGLVFENAKDKLDQAIVVVDRSGSLEFRSQLESYLKKKMNDETKRIKSVKMQRSCSNNLLQLADYVAGIINRHVEDRKKHADDYRKMIAHREMSVKVWP